MNEQIANINERFYNLENGSQIRGIKNDKM